MKSRSKGDSCGACWYGALVLVLLCAGQCLAASAACKKIVIDGEASAGREWHQSIGEGWIFRLMPIQPESRYSGWDLVVDREEPAGFPDALFLATPPYGSLNEREVGTTFGLRAQDAVGWNPRSFRFLIDPTAFHDAQRWYAIASRSGVSDSEKADALQRLMQLQRHAASGELRIEDARLLPGTADPQTFAQAWGAASARVPHRVDPVPQGQATPAGRLEWMRFSLTLWLPERWHVPATVHTSASATCPQ